MVKISRSHINEIIKDIQQGTNRISTQSTQQEANANKVRRLQLDQLVDRGVTLDQEINNINERIINLNELSDELVEEDFSSKIENLQRERESKIVTRGNIRDQISQLKTTEIQNSLGLSRTDPNENSGIPINVLNNYMNVQYHIVLSMIPEERVRPLQDRLSTRSFSSEDEFSADHRLSNVVVIASTGETLTNREIFVDELGEENNDPYISIDRNYYNISNMVIENITGLTAKNPMLSSMVSIKMQIKEPHGFNLHEDIRRTANGIGYLGLNLGRVLYRVDVWFSGYDQNTGEWISHIPISDKSNQSIKIVSYYTAIANIEAVVDSTGTTYDLSIVPSANFSYRPESFILDANSIFSGTLNTFGEFLLNLECILNQNIRSKTRGIIERRYRFYAPGILANAKFYASKFTMEKNYISEDRNGGQNIHVGRDVDITTLIYSAMADLEEVQALFLADGSDNNSFLNPRVHFTVRFNVKYGDENGPVGINEKIADYEILTYEYVIQPYITFKKPTIDNNNIAKEISDPTNQIQRVQSLLDYGMLTRIYNHTFTAENTEVINFELKFNVFYLNNLNEDGYVTVANHGMGLSESQSEINDQQLGKSPNVTPTVEIVNQGNNVLTPGALLGGDRPVRSPAEHWSNVVGPIGETPRTDPSGGISGIFSTTGRRAKYSDLLDDHLKNELLNMNNLQVRGDPIWLLSSYANRDIKEFNALADAVHKGEESKMIFPNVGRVIFLRIFAPTQNDYLNPNRLSGSSSPGIIGGFYEVLKVESTFQDGKFTQTINATKMNHLNFVEEIVKQEVTRSPSNNPNPEFNSLNGGSPS